MFWIGLIVGVVVSQVILICTFCILAAGRLSEGSDYGSD